MMQTCQLCKSKKVTACGARRLNSLFKTSDFTHSHHGKLSSGLIRAIFPLADTMMRNIEQLLGIPTFKHAMVTDISPSDDIILLCRACGLWCKSQH
ncbi:hypothetical protein [Rosenbergiella epipactidis]|uniref:hypothetical protein n=1 Tax=Rosenbergiella epipactidis TaxID=1544694 RepID=UPI001F4E663B|nr:hypothetical protein [Rosenbergiella epipactidis]